jgi:hypothetical protein
MAEKKKKEKVDKPAPTLAELQAMQKERLVMSNIEMSDKQLLDYFTKPDDLGEYHDGMLVPVGYKKCGACQHVMKLYLFNKNSGSKTGCTGNCKACQRESAAKSYKKTKQKRNYKKYYQENKEAKQEQARKYYQNNKEDINAKHKEYLQTAKGKKVMKKAHAKRADAIAKHKGIPYARWMVLDRDKRNGEHPICYLCGQPILDTSGASCHLDHVVSIVNGGLDCFTNIAAVHQTCNLTKEKDDRNLSVDMVEEIVKLAEDYIDAHPDLFDNEEE